MKLHGSAALTVRQRRRMVSRVLDQGWTQKAAAAAEQVSQRTCSKWVARYRSEGESGLGDRSSAPRSQPRRTSARRIEAICALRRLRLSGPEIAELLAMPASRTSAIRKREGLGRLGGIGLEPAERCERSRAGELVHVDIKKLGRIEGGAGKRVTGGITRNKSPRRRDLDGVDRCVIGWDYVHVAVDDYSRLAYAEVLPNEKATTAVAFLSRAMDHFARHACASSA